MSLLSILKMFRIKFTWHHNNQLIKFSLNNSFAKNETKLLFSYTPEDYIYYEDSLNFNQNSE